MVLCNKLFLKKQDPLELCNLQSQYYDRPLTAPTREDTICISLLQQSRHNSTVTTDINSVRVIQENSNASHQHIEPKNKFFKIFQYKKSNTSTPIEDVNAGGIEMQTVNVRNS